MFFFHILDHVGDPQKPGLYPVNWDFDDFLI